MSRSGESVNIMNALNDLQVNLDDTAASLTNLISLYTTQLDEFDRYSADYFMTCVGFGGVIFGTIITLLIVRQRQRIKIIDRLKAAGKDWKWMKMNGTQINLRPTIRRIPKETLEEKLKNPFKRLLHKTDIKVFEYNPSFDPELANINRGISLLFLIIPMIVMLYLYVFSMQCRKVAIYRGYLWYLEDELNKKIETKVLFDNGIVDKFIGGFPPTALSPEQFLTNRLGPVVMGMFVLGIYIVSFAFADYFSNWKVERMWGSRFYRYYRFWFLLLLLACSGFSLVCMYDLCVNGTVVEEVHRYCVEIARKTSI